MVINLGEVDKASPVPLYYQIYGEIKKAIDEEHILEGDMLYSEMTLREYFKVSRVTVRNALDQLEREGYIERSAGRGTIVKDFRNTFRWSRFTSFSEDINRMGETLTSIILDAENVKPTKKLASLFDITEEDEVFHLNRIRLINGVKVALNDVYISPKVPLKLRPWMFDEHTSLFSMLTDAGLKIGTCDETIEAKIPTPSVKELLEMDENSAIFKKERITYDIDRVPFEFSVICHNAEYYKYFVKNSLAPKNGLIRDVTQK